MYSDLDKPIYEFNSKLKLDEFVLKINHSTFHYSGVNLIQQYRNFIDDRERILTKVTPPNNNEIISRFVKEEIFLSGGSAIIYSLIHPNNLVDVHCFFLEQGTLLIDLYEIIDECRQKLACS